MTHATLPARLRNWARALKREILMLWFAQRDPRTPWSARIVCMLAVAYALSPIDLIPDFIPVLGFVDDVLLLPAMIWLAIRLLPAPVVADSRAQAERWIEERRARPTSRSAAAVIVALWIAIAAAALYAVLRWLE